MATVKPNFWQNNNVEPKRGYRFILSIQGGTSTSDSTGFSEWLIKNVKKPSFAINPTAHNYLNHTFHYPGRVTWNECSFVIVDTVNPGANASEQLMKLLEESGYELPTVPSTAAFRTTVSKAAASAALGQVYIKTLNAIGEEVERWVLNNAWIKSADFGSYDYTTEDLQQVTIGLQYDNAYIAIQGGNTFPTTPGVNVP